MKILMLNYEFPPLGGGASPVTYNLAKELVRQGHNIDVVTMGFTGLKRFEVVDGINVYRVPCLRRKKEICHTYEMTSYALRAIPMVLRLIKERQYDLNHTHFIFPTGLLSFIIKKITGLKYILTAHGSDVPGHNPDRFKLQYKFLLPLWKIIAKNASQIISPSCSLKSLILGNLPNSDVVVIPNGINKSMFTIRKKEKKILLASRIFEFKGFQYFLEAIRDMELQGYEVNIIGDGPYLDKLKDKAKALNLDNVTFQGYLDNNSKEFRDLFELSNIFIFPSEKENFPTVLLEAMSAGMAIITTNAGGCPEVVGDAALLVRPRDPVGIRNDLLKLIHDDKLRKNLSDEVLKRVTDKFSWQNVAAKYVLVYKEVA